MSWLTELYDQHLLIFALVLARIAGLVIMGPLFSAVEIPARFRAAIAVVLALVVSPTLSTDAVPPETTLLPLALAASGELLIGLMLGMGVTIVISGAQMAGHLVAQLCGLSAAEVVDPGSAASVPLMSRMLQLIALAVYVTIGAHRWLISGLLDTFSAVPLGTGRLSDSIGTTLLTLLAQSYSLGLRIAAPAVLSLLIATLVLGMISRTLPQLNLLALGFGINVLAGLGVLSISLGTLAWVFEDELRPAMTALFDAIRQTGPATHVFW